MHARYEFDLLCIGSGPAGQRAAVQAAKLGKRVAIVEQRPIPGGICVERGTLPSKTFREAVLSFGLGSRHVERFGGNGPQGRPAVEQLLARIEDVMQREVGVVRDQLRRNDIVFIQGQASFFDPHAVMVRNGGEARTVSADNILIAVGTVPARPDVVSEDGGIILTSDKRTRLLEFLDSEIVDELMHQMRNRNVTFRLGEAVERVELTADQPPRAALLLESGKRIVSDSVLYSIGRIGATEPLNLAAAGLTADKRGRLKVDEKFRTEVPHIFAAGDVIGYPSLASTSASQGRWPVMHSASTRIRYPITSPSASIPFLKSRWSARRNMN